MLTKYERELLSRLDGWNCSGICKTPEGIVVYRNAEKFILPTILLHDAFFTDEDNFPNGKDIPTPIKTILKIGKYAAMPKDEDIVLTRAGLKYRVRGNELHALFSNEVLNLKDYNNENKSSKCPSEDILMIIRGREIVFDNWEA